MFTFNMGIGMVIVVPREEADKAIKYLNNRNETGYILGEVIDGEKSLEIL